MFLISDDQAGRHEVIRSFLTEAQAPIAVILAAVDFEWTVRRAVLSMGTNPTQYIRRNVMNRNSSLDHYKQSWKSEVFPHLQKTLPDVISNWSRVQQAFRQRGRLVHGVVGTVKLDVAETSVTDILLASLQLEQYATKNGGTLYRRIIRRKTRSVRP